MASAYQNEEYNEEETKADFIDPALRKSGWITKDNIRVRKEYPITKGRLIGNGKREAPLYADYILQYKNRNLAVIEAKSVTKYYTEGVGQAKEYAKRLGIRFTYSTNGKKIYAIDMETGLEKDIDCYPTPDELWEKTYPPKKQTNEKTTDWLNKFYEIPFNDRGGTWQPRYYQENAINSALKAIAEGKQRILITLATGTGKTAISFQIVWKLFQTRWNNSKDANRTPRILFLADRNTLADQAFNAYNAFEENALKRITPKQIKKDGQLPKNGSIFFTIFQTFMSGPEETPYFGQYPKDFFDLVIIDECHRGGANNESTWRGILDYFDSAVQIGMTATPKRDENVDTYKYFGDPVYIYSLKEGINDGFLTPFRVQEISTTQDTYKYTEDDEILEGEIDPEKEYDIDDQNRIIEIKDLERYRVKILMGLINQNQKSLVFCASQNHAAAIRDLINQYSDSTNPDYCCRVTANDGEIGEQHLKEFKNNERTIPTILTTSQKLSTGIDAPEIRNIILLRTIKSMIEFKQIIGRGTRLYEGKDYFTIYDFVKAHELFKDPSWDGNPVEIEIDDPNKPKRKTKAVNEPPETYTKEPIIKVKLSDGKIRDLDSMVKTTFWSPSGKQMSAEEFVKQLFKDIPKLFSNETELRKIWRNPETRKQLLNKLESIGYSESQLEELSKLIHGENSDLFDVLSYIAYNKPLLMRSERAEMAKEKLSEYGKKQQEFLNFVLSQYVNVGVKELDIDKLPSLITLKYVGVTDGLNELGGAKNVREMFKEFQAHLYSEA